MKAKFNIQDILPIALTLVIAGIGITFGMDVIEDTREDIGETACDGYWNTTSQQCEVSTTNSTVLSDNTAAYNATTQTLNGVAKIPEKMGLIATVVVAAIIIGVLVRYLMVRYT